ncbi:anti sigma factor C-terminal domain-containing protein [Clostridium beijerinckii]|uniref:anti sigma factor C-terminal domain-containing protein n=1 Tax=Clostridium beijerinckii TaxID=1520 RepID=UPI00313B1491
MKNLSKDIDELFSDRMEEEIKKEVKKKRNKLNVKLIAIGIISTLIIIIVGNLALNFASNKYVEGSYSKEKIVKQLEYSIMYPNEYVGEERCIEMGYFNYETVDYVSKRIGSRVLFTGLKTNNRSIFDNKFEKVDQGGRTISNIPLNDDINKRYSTAYGLRELHFLYPYVNYGRNIYEYETDKNKRTEDEISEGKENIINDFHFLDEMDDNKMVEMALSFDKYYTYEEVNSILDSNLITFYWVDNNSDEEKKHIIEFNNPAFNVIGIKSIDGAGEFRSDTDGRMENFKAAIKQLKDIGEAQYIKNIDENDIRIIGAVVVGSPKELKAIENNPIIKHAVLGTVVDKY